MLVVIPELGRLVDEQLADSLLSLEVPVQHADEFIHAEVVIFENTLLDGDERVGEVCCAGHEHACRGVFCSALLNRASALHAALRHHGGKDHRVAHRVIRLHHVVADADLVIEVQKLLLDRILQLLDVPELPRVAGLQSHQVSRRGIHAVVQHQLQHLRGVDIARVRGAVGGSAARARLDAADNGPVSGLFFRAALPEGHLHGCLVVEEAGVCHTGLYHPAAFPDQRFRRVLPYAQGQHRLRGLHLGRGVQA